MNPPRPNDTLKSEPPADWTDEELSAAVRAYLNMLRHELAGQSYVKSAINRSLREGPLHSRTKASIEFRMQNISATLYDLKAPFITGYLPAKNVGKGVKDRIMTVLHSQGMNDLRAYIPTADVVELEQKVKTLRKAPFRTVPLGSETPSQVTSTTTSFVRDPAVKRWILDEANGLCEGCTSPAPFHDREGYPYLEVHHVMPLASRGSDRISNAVALCPNCHRRCHFADDRDEFKLSLYEKIGRLQIEVPGSDEAAQRIFID
jgi:5-methylcytosine-specific restriction protein A